jgi:hypothetical protein
MADCEHWVVTMHPDADYVLKQSAASFNPTPFTNVKRTLLRLEVDPYDPALGGTCYSGVIFLITLRSHVIEYAITEADCRVYVTGIHRRDDSGRAPWFARVHLVP